MQRTNPLDFLCRFALDSVVALASGAFGVLAQDPAQSPPKKKSKVRQKKAKKGAPSGSREADNATGPVQQNEQNAGTSDNPAASSQNATDNRTPRNNGPNSVLFPSSAPVGNRAARTEKIQFALLPFSLVPTKMAQALMPRLDLPLQKARHYEL